MCKEPDNLSAALAWGYSSTPEVDIEEELLFKKISIICNKGRIKLGQGDNSLGPKVPHMMKKLGLTEIGVRGNDRVSFLEPPYEDSLQQHQLENLRKHWFDEKSYKFWIDRERKEFLAGGGDPQEFDRCEKIANKVMSIRRQQAEDGEYFACSTSFMYIIKGRKPKRI